MSTKIIPHAAAFSIIKTKFVEMAKNNIYYFIT